MSTHFLLHYFLLGLQFSKFKIKFNPGLSLLLFPQFTASNELSRCCSGGSKHFKEHGNCVSVRAVGSSHSCNRAGSICCLRSLIDASCQAGLLYAQRHKVCSAVNINELAGGVKMECCDCCLLAKELSERNEACIAPIGFSPDCLEAFNKCCNQTIAANKPSFIGSSQVQSVGLSIDLEGVGNASSCSNAKCEHLCTIREDGTSQCSCRSGFDLAPDGRSCVDIDECHQLQQNNPNNFQFNSPPLNYQKMPLCDFKREICVNIIGGYGCRPAKSVATSKSKEPKLSPKTPKRGPQRVKNNGRFVYKTVGNRGGMPAFWSGRNGGGREEHASTTFIDVDECTLGAHDCGPMYQCKNTQGSFRCVPKRCEDNQVLDPGTGECKSVNCPPGYRPRDGRCEDVDECREKANACPFYEECVNTPGSFRCQEQGNVCSNGYYMDRESGFCLDIDECQRGTHTCTSIADCINLPGMYRCKCATGFEFNEYTMRCEDIDECIKFSGHACSLQADCVNSIGSYQCICKPGFSLAADNRSCDDINECELGIAKCQQKCINSPGSYQCICDRGYQLGIDEATCEDIDECKIWAKSGNELCMGKCINTPGSFLCTCPEGYQVMSDGITCKDIDECSENSNLCNIDQICINLLGSFKCERIECPRNYIPDRTFKNRCLKKPGHCENMFLERCKKLPIHISWQHIAIPKQVNISLHRTSVTLFSMKGPPNQDSSMQFELRLVSAKQGSDSVTPAIRANFLLQKGEDHNSAIIALRDSLDGPQEVHLELTLRLTTNGQFNGKYVANLLVFVSQYRPQTQHSRLHRIRRL
uniref:Fibulin-1 n=1 Tax=Meloidogyne enterolobii TaxID=390850 RepID=A0A6V7VQU3_MELEN|nr:unnamed protein product [Meloidogyne enterolobii]